MMSAVIPYSGQGGICGQENNQRGQSFVEKQKCLHGEQETGINEQSQTPTQTGVNRVLEREIELLHQRLNDKNDVISDLRERLDMESEERRKLTMLLTDMREKTPRKPAEKQKGFWATLIRKNH